MATQRTAQQSRGRRSGQTDGAARKRKLPDKKAAIELLEKMLLIRHFEERAQEMYMKAKIGGFLHLAVGEEATIVGTTSVMRDDDYLISTYREHGPALARGTDPKNVMAELFGKETGTSHGRGGSMHLFDLERRFMGGYGIVGGNLPLAAGLALASDYKGEDSVTLCMFGDGASNQGTFGETMNIAALWKLPVVFLVVNNQYGMGTALSRHSAVTDLSSKAECLGVPGERVDGMDVLAVRECRRRAPAPRARGPATHARRGAHLPLPRPLGCRSRGLPDQGGSAAVARARPDHSPMRSMLQEAGYLDEQGFEELDRKAIELVDEAVKFADESPAPAARVPVRQRLRARRPGPGLVLRRRAHSRGAPRRGRARGGQDRRRARARRGRRRVCRRGRRAEAPARRTGRRDGPRGCRPGRSGDVPLMATMRYREALNQAMREEMRADESVFLMGEDVGVFQGAFKVSEGMLEEFGEKRVRDTPISENTIVGMGVGAAMAGLRPIVEIMTVNFALLAMDQIINSAAHIHYMFGGQAKVPLVVRFPQGGGHQLGPTHSHTMEAIFLHVPGLLVAVPSTPADAKGLLKAAIRDDNPVIYIEHESLYGMRGEVPDNGEPMRFGEAAIRREGNDVTIVGISRMAVTAERAAEELASQEDIEAEVIDPRTLRPLDLDTILESVRKTNRCVVVEEGWPHGGVGANIAALVQEQAFDDLDAPVQRVTGADVPMPYSKALEQAAIPHEEHVVKAALATFRDI